jgi:hypothetical protein
MNHLHDNDNKRPCAHCAINQALNEFFVEYGPVDMDDVIDDVTAVLCELLAYWDDRNMRRLSVKQIVELIPKRVAAFRAEGRYPGSPEQMKMREEIGSNGGDA